MEATAASALTLLALLLTGATSSEAQSRDYRTQNDLLRILLEKAWLGGGSHSRWGPPRIEADLAPDLERGPETPPDDDHLNNDGDNVMRLDGGKRSAVATALNAGRRRRQPAPALGKAVTSYVGVGVLNDMGTFFDALRDNLETLASLSPEQRSNIFQEPPTVVHAPAPGGGGGGIRKLHALRPLRPTGNIRSYNRRSFVEADGLYPGANHHDPGLLWTGLGR